MKKRKLVNAAILDVENSNQLRKLWCVMVRQKQGEQILDIEFMNPTPVKPCCAHQKYAYQPEPSY